jgi:hypothetical protein
LASPECAAYRARDVPAGLPTIIEKQPSLEDIFFAVVGRAGQGSLSGPTRRAAIPFDLSEI